MMLRLIVLTVSMVYLGAAEGPLRFELKRVEKKAMGCVITFQYPEIISASSPHVRDRMNAGILWVLLRRSDWPAPDSGVRSLDAYANVFLKECADLQTRPEGRDLYEHKLVTIFRYTPPILSFRCDATEDGGGVHPFGTTLFVNFEISTGKTVVITDLLREGIHAQLESIAEANFRRDYKLSSTESLSEQSYNFPDDHFRLNNNFGIGERELMFLFNAYEIGPGAMGAIEIRMPYQQIHNLFKPDLHLW
jgi:hypothetical protein